MAPAADVCSGEASGSRSLSIAFDYDVLGFDPDGLRPETPESTASKTGRYVGLSFAAPGRLPRWEHG